jgi:hypothetical protein
MIKIKLGIGALAVAALVGSPFAAEAKSSTKHKTHHSSSITTGSNMKSSTRKSNSGAMANPSSQGNVGPGTSNNNLGPASGGTR